MKAKAKTGFDLVSVFSLIEFIPAHNHYESDQIEVSQGFQLRFST